MAQFYDTLLNEYVHKPWERWLWLDSLAENLLNYKMLSYDEVTQKKKLHFRDVNLKLASEYSGEDVYTTAKIFKIQQERQEVSKIFSDIEMPLMEVIKKIEINWVKIDQTRLNWIWKILEKQIAELASVIFEKANTEFNINSPKQVWEVLFDQLQLPKWKKTKTGWSVAADVLDELALDYPIAKDIVLYRHYSKIQSTYIKWILDLCDSNSLVHTNYNQAVTSTWRLSSTNPNLQNIPWGSGVAWEIRDAFVSWFTWWSIIAFDYSQVEIRILAILSQDKNLLDAFKHWRDIHAETGKFLFGSSEITSEQRKIAKSVNFWVIYWVSGFGLSRMIDAWVKESNEYIDAFYENYPDIRQYFDKTIKDAERKLFVETLYWRRRYIAWINAKNKMVKNAAIREALNMPVQGTAADIIKLSMIACQKYLIEHKMQTKLIMQVHDELVFDVFPWEEKKIEAEMKQIMENIMPSIEVDLLVDTGKWKSRFDAK